MALLSSLVARQRFGCLLLLLGYLVLYAVGSLSLFCLFLYLGLCVLGDGALVGLGSFLLTRHLFLLISV